MVNILNEIFKKKNLDKNKPVTKSEPPSQKQPQSTEIYLKCFICLDKVIPQAFDQHLIDCFDKNNTDDHVTSIHDEFSFVTLVRTLNSKEQYVFAIEILTKVINNIVNNPNEMKYRKLRYTNKTISEKVNSLKFGIKLFEYLGFLRVNENEEDMLVLKSGQNLEDLTKQMEQLKKVRPLHKQLYSRNTFIFSPGQQIKAPHQINLNSDLDDAMFEMDMSEVAAHYGEIKRKNELAATLMTSKQREQLDPSKPTPLPFVTSLQFMFPDRHTVQAFFLLGETMGHVFTFLKTLVNYPGHHFKLFSAGNRKCYNEADTASSQCQLQQEGFYPNSTFHFKWDDDSKRSHLI